MNDLVYFKSGRFFGDIALLCGVLLSILLFVAGFVLLCVPASIIYLIVLCIASTEFFCGSRTADTFTILRTAPYGIPAAFAILISVILLCSYGDA